MEGGEHNLLFRFQYNVPDELNVFVKEMDEEKRKNTIRDIYEFLHARQLQVLQEQMNLKMDQLNMKMDQLVVPQVQQVPKKQYEGGSFFHSLWRNYVEPFTYAVVAGAGATLGILVYQHIRGKN